MHPEEVQISGAMASIVQEQILKPQEFVEDEIDVEKVDSGELNGAQTKELNGNGFGHKENGHPDQLEAEGENISEHLLKFVNDSIVVNAADIKSVLRVKSSRRNSTSSRSSSVSSAPSVKHQTPVALQMEVSMDEEEKEHMEPLMIEGTAEDLEVSKCAPQSEADNDADAVTTDSETVVPNEYDEETWPGFFEMEKLEQHKKHPKSGRRIKSLKSPSKPKSAVKVKTPRTKSLKLKASKLSSKVIDSVYDELPNEFEAENSDSNSALKDDLEVEDLKSTKSPSKQLKPAALKQDPPLQEVEGDDKSDTEHAPRRSSRARQTPQKYNSSLYAESYWDQNLADDRLNSSDATLGLSIRSVKGRRSLRKSRNISALNASLHNDSSPWETDFKVLTPCGGGLSLHDIGSEDKDDSGTPLKRKASDEDDHEDDERGKKKMCVDNAELDNSVSSQTSSFFSIITSPIMLLKNKLRGPSVSSSTPIKSEERNDIDSVSDMESDFMTIPDNANEIASPNPQDIPVVPAAQEVRSWCSIM